MGKPKGFVQNADNHDPLIIEEGSIPPPPPENNTPDTGDEAQELPELDVTASPVPSAPAIPSTPALPHALTLPELEIPRGGRPISAFCKELVEKLDVHYKNNWSKTCIVFKDTKTWTGRNKSRKKSTDGCKWCVKNGRIGRIIPNMSKSGLENAVFRPFTPEEFVTSIEEYFRIVKITGFGLQLTSLSIVQAKVVLASDILRKSLPVVDRLLIYSIPIGIGEYPPPTKGGPRAREVVMCPAGFGSYREEASGEIVNFYCHFYWAATLSLAQAKTLLKELYSECHWTYDHSYTNALAHLLTPFCQALMGWGKKSPLWLFTANGPRAGKDYLAMFSLIINEGIAVQDPPLEDESELKRRITSAIVSGRRFQHMANCRGRLSSPSLEAAITTQFWADRLIGTSDAPVLTNELIFSLSYNGNLPLTEDLRHRSRRVQLNTKPGPVNTYSYVKPDLHSRLYSWEPKKGVASPALCRRDILRALLTIVEEWATPATTTTTTTATPPAPPPALTFTSFPEWAKVVGGIMVAAGLGNPTEQHASDFLEMGEQDALEKDASNWREFLRLGSWFAINKVPPKHSSQILTAAEWYPELFPGILDLGVDRLGMALPKWVKQNPKYPANIAVTVNHSDENRPKYQFAFNPPDLPETFVEFADVLKVPKAAPAFIKPTPPDQTSTISTTPNPTSEGSGTEDFLVEDEDATGVPDEEHPMNPELPPHLKYGKL